MSVKAAKTLARNILVIIDAETNQVRFDEMTRVENLGIPLATLISQGLALPTTEGIGVLEDSLASLAHYAAYGEWCGGYRCTVAECRLRSAVAVLTETCMCENSSCAHDACKCATPLGAGELGSVERPFMMWVGAVCVPCATQMGNDVPYGITAPYGTHSGPEAPDAMG